jgi:hypothetical protein
MERSERFPDWIPFDGANARFVRTPADSRLAPPVLVRETPRGPFTIVFPQAGEPARKRHKIF